MQTYFECQKVQQKEFVQKEQTISNTEAVRISLNYFANMLAARIIVRRMSYGCGSSVQGPSSNPISFPEKIAHGLIIAGSCLTVPGWVLANMNNYRGQKS